MGKAGEVSPAPGWSPWRPLEGVPAMSEAVLIETLDGGQAFRWFPTRAKAAAAFPAPVKFAERGEEVWNGVWGQHVAHLRLDSAGRVEWSAPTSQATRTGAALATYCGGAQDFAALTDSLPIRSDSHLARCVAAFPGLRILRQPFGETLLGFLCSATKQIVQIKQMVGLLAARHGAEIVRGYYRLPTWTELAAVPETELRACLLGFRARYIAETARFLVAHPGWLEETEAAPYAVAKERLCSLPGVGEKVADCVLLFGAGKLEAFPVDVWILKTMARRYGLEGWKPAQVAHFGRVHFGPLAGFAQQYLFAWERWAARHSLG